MSEVTITQLTAVYAAIVSTATAAWSIYKDWNDRGKLRVTVGFRSLVGSGAIEENLLVWNITNVGRRSSLLTHAGGEQENNPGNEGFNSFLVNDFELPKRLEPGDYHMSICREFDFGSDLKSLFATDSLGRRYYAESKDVEAVNKTLRELAGKGISKSTLRSAR